SVPTDGAADAPLDRPIGLRFATPLAPDALAAATIVCEDADRIVASRAVLAEGGRLIVVTPDEAFQPAHVYTLILDGLHDEAQRSLAQARSQFTTGGSPEAAVTSGGRAQPDRAGATASASGSDRSGTTAVGPVVSTSGPEAPAGSAPSSATAAVAGTDITGSV